MTAMTLRDAHYRRGMTLIELLVVITILGLLAVTVIPNIANTGGRRNVREAARAVSSFIAAGQSRALGSRGGGGVWIDPLPNSIASGTLSIGAAIDLADADIAAAYSGDSTTSAVTVQATLATTASCAFSGGCNPPSTVNNLIRLQGSPSWFGFTWVSGSSGLISLRPGANQTLANTSWPNSNSALAYEIIGPPTRSTGNTLTLGDGVAIDLMHSSLGGIQSLVRTGTASFQILYDSTGRPYNLCCGGVRIAINDPIFLLVAPIESIQISGTVPAPDGTFGTLAPTDGYWVSIDPRGGIPKVAEVKTSGTSILDQQSLIRSGAAQLGR